MAHLSFEYSANLDQKLNIQGFCDHMRDVMHASGVFPLGGIRVRGTRVDACAVASGEAELAFIDMTLRMGMGRDEEVGGLGDRNNLCRRRGLARSRGVGERPFALSLETLEINARFSQKRFNTIHGFLKHAGPGNG